MMKMKLIRREDIVQSVPDRWKLQYFRRGAWISNLHNNAEEIYNKLVAARVEGKLTQSFINELIGNNSWTRCRCDNCNQDRRFLVHYGDEVDYEAQYQRLCLSCLKKGVALLEENY